MIFLRRPTGFPDKHRANVSSCVIEKLGGRKTTPSGTTPLLSSQAAQTAPLQLTLKDSIALALRQNIDVQVANINLAASQQDRKISRSALLPQASLKATDEVERYNLQGLIGVPIGGLPKNIGPFQSINIGHRFSTPVFDLSLLRKYQASGHRLEASKEDEKSTREETVLLTTAQYPSLLRAEASVNHL